jgi:hypothetical protein
VDDMMSTDASLRISASKQQQQQQQQQLDNLVTVRLYAFENELCYQLKATVCSM